MLLVDIVYKEGIQAVAQDDCADTYLIITDTIQLIEEICPILFGKLVPWKLDDHEIAEQTQSLVGVGDQYANLYVSSACQPSKVQSCFPVKLIECSVHDLELQKAYIRDSSIEINITSNAKKFVYRKKVFVFSRSMQKKIIFSLDSGIKT